MGTGRKKGILLERGSSEVPGRTFTGAVGLRPLGVYKNWYPSWVLRSVTMVDKRKNLILFLTFQLLSKQ